MFLIVKKMGFFNAYHTSHTLFYMRFLLCHWCRRPDDLLIVLIIAIIGDY